MLTTQTVPQEAMVPGGRSACMWIVFRALLPPVKTVGRNGHTHFFLGVTATMWEGGFGLPCLLDLSHTSPRSAHISHVTAGWAAVSRKSIGKTSECQRLTHRRPSRE